MTPNQRKAVIDQLNRGDRAMFASMDDKQLLRLLTARQLAAR